MERFAMGEELDWLARNVTVLMVPRVGCVAGGDAELPWVLLDADGSKVESAAAWLIDLHASDYPPATLRSYAYDLLSWHRLLWAVGVSWRQATRAEVRDWVRWQRQSPIAQRHRSTREDTEPGRPAAGSVNARTGKPYLGGGRTAPRSTMPCPRSAASTTTPWRSGWDRWSTQCRAPAPTGNGPSRIAATTSPSTAVPGRPTGRRRRCAFLGSCPTSCSVSCSPGCPAIVTGRSSRPPSPAAPAPANCSA